MFMSSTAVIVDVFTKEYCNMSFTTLFSGIKNILSSLLNKHEIYMGDKPEILLAERAKDKDPIIFYIDKNDMDSNKVVYSLLDKMFSYKYYDTKFYCHNFGRFDVLFMLKALVEYKLKTDKSEITYKLDVICRKDEILKLTITKVVKSLVVTNTHTEEIACDVKTYKISIMDSYPILTDSLQNLSIKYGLENRKDIFPHTFANESTLFYKGNTPDIRYYKDIYKGTYNSIYKKD